MGNGDDDTATQRAVQRAELPHEVATHSQLSDTAATAGVTIRPGRGVDSVRVRVPNLDEFECSIEDARDWLRRAGYDRDPQVWTPLDQQLNDAIHRGVERAQQPGHGHGQGDYAWEDYGQHGDQPQSASEEERTNEAQTQAWNRMLDAWHQFEQQVNDLRAVAGSDAQTVIGQVGHTITALNMIENQGWASPYQEEFAEWERLSPDGVSTEELQTAVTTIADAGQSLVSQWHAAIGAGNYEYYSLTYDQHQFIQHCSQAREALHH